MDGFIAKRVKDRHENDTKIYQYKTSFLGTTILTRIFDD